MKKTKYLTALILTTLIAVIGCNNLPTIPPGTTIGVNGNDSNVTASIGVPVGDHAIVTATGSINPQDPSQWTAGFLVVLREYKNPLLEAIASVPGSTYDRSNPYQFHLIDDAGVIPTAKSPINRALQILMADPDVRVLPLSSKTFGNAMERSLTPNWGANKERTAILAYVRRERAQLVKQGASESTLDQWDGLIQWLLNRNERYNVQPGGLGK